MAKPTPIDPFDQQHWNKPLFVVYGSLIKSIKEQTPHG
jgi:hypothetical protein